MPHRKAILTSQRKKLIRLVPQLKTTTVAAQRQLSWPIQTRATGALQADRRKARHPEEIRRKCRAAVRCISSLKSATAPKRFASSKASWAWRYFPFFFGLFPFRLLRCRSTASWWIVSVFSYLLHLPCVDRFLFIHFPVHPPTIPCFLCIFFLVILRWIFLVAP